MRIIALHIFEKINKNALLPPRRMFLVFGIALIALRALADAPAALEGLHTTVFTEYAPLSSNAELARRLLTPLSAAQIPQLLARAGKRLSEQPINLAEENFALYVPAQSPPRGYALLVFVPPWQDARLPTGWAAVLDRYGVIFVSAGRSGNDETPLGRRDPLALMAAYNVMRRYAVDPDHVYIGGFSGGSRVALHLALGYPDVFRGALLNAGSDPIGNAELPLPPKDLFFQFQNSTRLVYVTGERDPGSLAADQRSIDSMREWCVGDMDIEVTHWKGHEAASPAALSGALQALMKPIAPDPRKLAECRAAVEAKLAGRFKQLESLIASGEHDGAQKLLHQIDARFGGLAAPRSLELAPK
jgi:pimeloyl-ACP methyl ester carboxylesterase